MPPAACEHIGAITTITHPARRECAECVRTGARWVHLRTCQECGVTLCCDSSPNKHASKHARAAHLGADLAVHHRVLVQIAAGECVVSIAVDEAGHDGLAQEIDSLRVGADQPLHVLRRADGQHASVAEGDGLRDAESRVDGEDLSVVEHQVRIGEQLGRRLRTRCGGAAKQRDRAGGRMAKHPHQGPPPVRWSAKGLTKEAVVCAIGAAASTAEPDVLTASVARSDFS